MGKKTEATIPTLLSQSFDNQTAPAPWCATKSQGHFSRGVTQRGCLSAYQDWQQSGKFVSAEDNGQQGHLKD